MPRTYEHRRSSAAVGGCRSVLSSNWRPVGRRGSALRRLRALPCLEVIPGRPDKLSLAVLWLHKAPNRFYQRRSETKKGAATARDAFGILWWSWGGSNPRPSDCQPALDRPPTYVGVGIPLGYAATRPPESRGIRGSSLYQSLYTGGQGGRPFNVEAAADLVQPHDRARASAGAWPSRVKPSPDRAASAGDHLPSGPPFAA